MVAIPDYVVELGIENLIDYFENNKL